ncbi:hypothetical protein BU15DRAFT_81457 [Melanogaster broomeanus]|nr:hypothetical protein BU15DRAFT_81457 [Melanogaster broomeanus]
MEHKISTTNENFIQRVDGVEASMATHMRDIKALITGVTSTSESTCRDGLRCEASVLLPTQAGTPESGMNQPYAIPDISPQPTPTPSVHIPVAVPSKDAGKLGIARLGDESFAFDTSKSSCRRRPCEIPVKYWPEFYKKASGAKPHAWQALRVEWGNWKYIAEEWDRHHDSVSFWHKFSNERGEPLLYKAILEILAKQRNANTVQDATNARSFFGGNLSHPDAQGAFSYVKSGKTFLATKDDVIARKWQTLLKNDPDISARWAAIQTQAPTAGPRSSPSS